jgi:multicomponent K+:H+ antiporter subunit A
MSLVLIAALPFLGAVLPGLLIRLGRTAAALAAGAVTLTALILLAAEAPAVLAGGVVRIDWLPALGCFLSAGWLLILGIGPSDHLYARFYLSDGDPLGRFYGLLMLFQGAMLGIVLSDNILLMLIFWELTSLSSFLLIGFWKDRAERPAGRAHGAGGHRGRRAGLIAGMLILGRRRRATI